MRLPIRLTRLTCVAGGLLCILASPVAADPVDFVRDVQPILATHCYSCHGAERQRSGLRLDVKSEAFKGGELFEASIVAGNPNESPLVQFVADEDADLIMPPGNRRLTGPEIATLRRWVEEGAEWPDGVDPVTLADPRDHWSFRPLASAAPPPIIAADWPRQPVDRFILHRLEQAGLRPAREADRVEWLRRVTFDLTGVPPTPEEATSFLRDHSASAFERVVDRLLLSPRYGERWAQHWLDVVRYADTHGFEVNTERPHAWPYRDYVIDAFNCDRSYDAFIREQIAGDAIGAEAATGFLVTASVLLPGQIGKDEPSKRLARQDSLDEIVVNLGQTFLGLSVGCARCHDHKFDPISQQEYYAMQAFVAGVEYKDRLAIDPREEIACSNSEDQLVADSSDQASKIFAGEFREPDEIRFLTRGDPEQPKAVVGPSVPAALGSLQLSEDATEQERRRALAEWIASADNPLTARVMANRVWQGHFGQGLVETANDFGRSGSPPSHPELLDWLASELIRSGWSIKRLHRMIVLSATYRQSSHRYPDAGLAAQADADVRLLWRFPARRLEAEAIRDSMLAVSGQLDWEMYGRGFNLFDKRGGLTGFNPIESFEPRGLRRMVYAHKVRRERDGVFGAFDCPDAGQSTPRRRESTTPIQALSLFNSRFTLERADAFAGRVNREVGENVGQQVHRAYQLALTRDPDAEELRSAEAVVGRHGLATLGRVLFNSNEFLFIP